jgi:hypothetical protein
VEIELAGFSGEFKLKINGRLNAELFTQVTGGKLSPLVREICLKPQFNTCKSDFTP